jgi:hypothetical protein
MITTAMETAAFEKLGVFYLGRVFDLEKGEATPEPLLYDSKDLVTHAVCLGMTGSGKTGLCIGLLEEAAIDGVPAVIIDPKGDLANLLLTFPGLRPEDFRPWINEEDAARKGVSPDDYAAQQAETWKTGLADWGQDGARIAKLREAADIAIYTPGSEAGIPVSVVGSFAAPAEAVRDDDELLNDRIAATASGLLGLVGIEADPVRSREHILLSTILSLAWKDGRDLDLAALIQQIQTPPVTQVGVMAVDSFFPPKDRFELAMAVNNLLASPGFAAWMQGEPLDVGAFLRTKEGKPRLSIFSIAHLGDAERMFFVTLLLGEILAWTRSQSGTTSLRAIVYMDEIAGYFPPVANPPSKTPLLTMLKQARAFGVGVTLATQNPVDLDYKALSNIGTWLIGRLQTERDVDRVLDGLEGAAAGAGRGFEREDFRRIINGLGKRVFLMNNVHDDGPEVFQTRWTMSYLRGPLTRTQLKELTKRLPATAARAPAAPAAEAAAAAPVSTPSQAAPAPSAPAGPVPPVLPPEVPQYFLPSTGGSYAPMLYGSVSARFTDAKAGLDVEKRLAFLTPVTDNPVAVDWSRSQAADVEPSDLGRKPDEGVTFLPLPGLAGKAASYTRWQRELGAWVAGSQQIDLLRSPSSKLVSAPGEAERDFRARIQQASREGRDAAVEKIRQKYQTRMVTLQERIRKAEQAVEREREQAQDAKMQTAVSMGATLVGALFGGRRKLRSLGGATTAARGVSRSVKQQQDVARARETVEALSAQLAGLESQLQAELDGAGSSGDPATEPLETVSIRPKKTAVQVQLLALVWAPSQVP